MTRLVALLTCLAVQLVALLSWGGPLRLTPESGPAPMTLMGSGSEYRASFSLLNTSAEPIEVSAVTIRTGGEFEPAVPRDTKVELDGGRSSVQLAPGGKIQGVVTYRPARDARARQFSGHVRVTAAGEAPVALGFQFDVARVSGSMLPYLPLALVLIPLGVALFLFFGGGRLAADMARKVAGGGALASLVLAAVAFAYADPNLSRYDGGQGFHWLTRRIVSGGVEVAYGLDGLNLTFALLLPLLFLVAAAVGRSEARPGIWGALALLQAALSAIVVGQDVLTVSVGFLVLWLTVLVLTRVFDCVRAGYLPAAAALIAVMALVVLGQSCSGLLLDGRPASWVTSFLELPFVVDAGNLAGGHPARIIVPLLLASLLPLMGAPLVGGYARALLRRASTPVQIALLAGVGATAGYMLLRVLVGVMPSGLLWAARAVTVLGVVGATLGAISAARTSSAAERTLALGSVLTSLSLVALGSLTGAAVQAAVLLVVARSLSVALVLAASTAGSPVTRALGRALGLATAGGAPLTLGFVALSETLVAALPLHPWVAPVLLIALGFGGALGLHGALREVQQLRGASLQADPDETRDSAVLVLAALVVLLGIAPRSWLLRVDASHLDHADRLNPPGLLEVVRAPTCPRTLSQNV
ncbi:MAG: hypothetical protein R3B13_32875 [Polyangiaceae bacterium]